MNLSPSFSDFKATYQSGKNQLVYTRLVNDLETPVSLMLRLTSARKNSFMLESVTGGENRGRYSIIGMDPDLIWECHGDKARLNRKANSDELAFELLDATPLASLRALLDECALDLPADLPPMAAGLFGFLGYDMIRQVENLPNINPDILNIPDAIMQRPTVVAVIDGVKNEVILIAPAWNDGDLSADAAYIRASERIMAAKRDMTRPLPALPNVELTDLPSTDIHPNLTKDEYFEIIKKAKEYIKAGDIFQVVPSQRWSQDFKLPPFSLYRALRCTNPSPYMFFFNYGDFQIVGASPEILVQVKGRQVTIRPIAGTRPRGVDEAQDLVLEQDLLSDPKEMAEHLMLLDLGRNDVGRVAKTGTVDPNQQFIIEHYSHVMHIVSNVIGELNDNEDALSALLAGLPAGTVSGAPKIRAMEIIDELEPEKRGVYGGGIGYFSVNGDMDICIALRTSVLKDDKIYIQAGGGVVYDSDPESEYQETVNKSKALRQAAQDARLFVNVRDTQ